MAEVSLQLAYNRSVTSWQVSISEYEDATDAAAQAMADYKQARGRLIVKAKFADPKVSAVALEAMADADDDVAALLHKRLVAEAAVDGLKQRLFWHRAQADNLRTQVVDEREHNRLASSTGAGPGQSQVQPAYSPPSGRGRPVGGRFPPPREDEPPEDPWASEPPERTWG